MIHYAPPPKELVELGLAISGATLRKGETRTHHEIACYISAAIEVMTGVDRGFSWQRVWQIEQKALRKVRFRLKQKLGKDYELQRNSLE